MSKPSPMCPVGRLSTVLSIVMLKLSHKWKMATNNWKNITSWTTLLNYRRKGFSPWLISRDKLLFSTNIIMDFISPRSSSRYWQDWKDISKDKSIGSTIIVIFTLEKPMPFYSKNNLRFWTKSINRILFRHLSLLKEGNSWLKGLTFHHHLNLLRKEVSIQPKELLQSQLALSPNKGFRAFQNSRMLVVLYMENLQPPSKLSKWTGLRK